jgi:hypothetical protein
VKLAFPAALLLATSVFAQQSIAAFRGEKLQYEIRWAGMVVGHSWIECLPTNEPGLLAIRTTSHANKAIQSMYPVRDTIQSVVEAATGLPIQFKKIQREGSYAADIRIDFRRAQSTAFISGGSKSGKPRPDTTITLDGTEFDLLSAYMHARASDLEPGKSRYITMVDNRKRFGSVEIQCLRRELLETDTGKVKTVVVEPKIHGDALFASKGKLWIWFTDDAAHVPVRMESKIALGTIKAILVARQAP